MSNKYVDLINLPHISGIYATSKIYSKSQMVFSSSFNKKFLSKNLWAFCDGQFSTQLMYIYKI